MTSSAEKEALFYWRAASAVNRLRRSAGPRDDMDDALTELEAVVLHTRWRRLRTVAATIIAMAVPVEAMAAVAVLLEAVC